MGTGYIRTDTSDNIANGNVIDADDLDTEFNAVESAFNSSTGHTHDGTSSEGAPITVVGPAQDIVVTTTVMRPKTTNFLSLGSDAVRYKDIFLEGNADVDGTINVEGATTLQATLDVTSNATIGGNLTVTGNATIAGNLTFGDAATDTVSFAADVNSNLLPATDDTYDLGAVGAEWRNLYIDGTANIDTAAVDTANVATANVATLNVTGNADVDGDLTVTGTINSSISGDAATAARLTTSRTIALGGDVSGAVNFDGSQNITINTIIADDSHNHTIANVDGLQAVLDSKSANLSDLGITANIAELNILDGVNATTAELSFVNGVTSNIQTQLDSKLNGFSLETYTGDVDIDGELIVTSYNETFQAVSSSGGSTIVNCEAGNVFSHTLSENTTFTFTNPPLSGTAYGFTLKLVQDASGSGYTVTWPSSVDWPFGRAPTLRADANDVDHFVFYTHDGGTTWYGFLVGKQTG